MQLKKVSAVNAAGDLLEFPLEDISAGFLVKGIDGLGPVKATLVSSSFATMDGEQYHSARRETRNIIIKLGLDPNYGEETVYDLRSRLYDFFMTKTEILLKFNLYDRFEPNTLNRDLNLNIYGVVESCEPDIFARDPSVAVSIMCYDPEFVDPNLRTFNGQSVNDHSVISPLVYKGSVETGVRFQIFPDRTVPNFFIHSQAPGQSEQIAHFMETIQGGDILEISSVSGNKHVTRIRGGVATSQLFALAPQSAWVEIFKGTNNLHVFATPGSPVPYTVEYYHRYGGL
jgi:hypothetical protein